MINKSTRFVLYFILFLCPILAAQKSDVIPPGAKAVADHFNSDRMKADLQFLSSDLLEGRGTGARGGNIAATYISTQFALAGLKPAGGNGSYTQKVPLVGVTTDAQSALQFIPAKGEPIQLKYLDDFIAN